MYGSKRVIFIIRVIIGLDLNKKSLIMKGYDLISTVSMFRGGALKQKSKNRESAPHHTSSSLPFQTTGPMEATNQSLINRAQRPYCSGTHCHPAAQCRSGNDTLHLVLVTCSLEFSPGDDPGSTQPVDPSTKLCNAKANSVTAAAAQNFAREVGHATYCFLGDLQ
jgi:hypothetical protein